MSKAVDAKTKLGTIMTESKAMQSVADGARHMSVQYTMYK